MKISKITTLLTLFVLLLSLNVKAQSPNKGMINHYAEVSFITGSTVTLNGITKGVDHKWGVGDKVLLTMETDRSHRNGGIYGNSYVVSVNGNEITLGDIKKEFTNEKGGKTQLVWIPEKK